MQFERTGFLHLRALSILVLVFTVGMLASDSHIKSLLPEPADLGPDVNLDYRQYAEGEDLVELINGGAVLYFKHGFSRALFQEYSIDSTQYINLEIYEMTDEKAAMGIFHARSDASAQAMNVGLKGYQDDYFCSFYRDRYYVVITSSDSREKYRQIFLHAAEILDRKITAND